MTHINLNLLNEVMQNGNPVSEVVLLVSIGSFVAYQDPIVEIKADRIENIDLLEETVRKSIYLEESRDLSQDPAYGITQLETIAWTVTSTAKSNLAPGLQVIFSLRDLLARWSDEAFHLTDDAEDAFAIVYNDDLIEVLFGTFESLAVVAAESKEHQILTEILITFSTLLERLPEPWQQQLEEAVLRLLPTVRAHVLTKGLEAAILKMVQAFQQIHRKKPLLSYCESWTGCACH